MRPFDGRRVLLVVSGGIAAYKSAFLCRRLLEAGASVEVILTESARRFVGAVTFEGLTGRSVHEGLWEAPMAHLDLGSAADVAIVAPATAHMIARMAAGMADDLATTTLLAFDGPVVVCPAMNTRMWEHPATRRNVRRLEEDGCRIVGPADGPLAEGESGPGRLAEPREIVAAAGRALAGETRWTGRKVVATAGPTRAPLDPVRYLGNRSSGRMGYALAAAAWRRGAEVTLITGPGSAPRPPGPRVMEVETSREMLSALQTELTDADILLMAAAVGDFEVASPSAEKWKKEGRERVEIELEAGPDLLGATRDLRRERGIVTLGFALETDEAIAEGRRKLEEKDLELIAVNLANEEGAGFEVSTNRVTLLHRSGESEELPLMSKDELAERLLDRIEDALPA